MRHKVLHCQAVHITVLCVIIKWVQTGLLFSGYKGLLPPKLKDLDMKLTIYLHVMCSLVMCGAKPPPIHMVCFLSKHIDNLIFDLI